MHLTTNQHKVFARAYLRRRRHSTTHNVSLMSAFTGHLCTLWDSLPAGSTIAGFLPLATEPPISDGLTLAHQAGHRVIVPVVLPQRQLAWVQWNPKTPLTVNALGIAEPQGERLGPEAFIDAHLRLIPALAYDVHGHRLGQGGGYYDRLLGLLPAHALNNTSTLGVVFAHEILDGLPYASWDATLRHVLTEYGPMQLGTGHQNRVQ